MGLFFGSARNSGTVAKDRLKLLLMSERIQCSPNFLIMLKNDMIQTASKYVVLNEKQVTITYNEMNNLVIASFPLEQSNLRQRNSKTHAKII